MLPFFQVAMIRSGLAEGAYECAGGWLYAGFLEESLSREEDVDGRSVTCGAWIGHAIKSCRPPTAFSHRQDSTPLGDAE